MGPRPGDRGRIPDLVPNMPKEGLQWGRDPGAAEGPEVWPGRKMSTRLQWGRDSGAAEGPITTPCSVNDFELQWGRDSGAAEGALTLSWADGRSCARTFERVVGQPHG